MSPSLAALKRTALKIAVVALVVAAVGMASCERFSTPMATQLQPGSESQAAYGRTSPSPDGIGKTYMGREIARVMGHRGAGWLERSGRATSELPGRVVEAMNLQPSDVVVDLGAGTGYFTFRIAPEVPRGTVYAVDIQPEMLQLIRQKIERRDAGNVVPVRGIPKSPKLPEGRIDAALMVDAYHEFAYPREMMLGLCEALRPRGRVYLVEYRKEDATVPIKPLHKMTEKQAIREMRAIGLRHVRTEDILPRQHLMIFEKSAVTSSATPSVEPAHMQPEGPGQVFAS